MYERSSPFSLAYINDMQTIPIILAMAGLFLDGPHIWSFKIIAVTASTLLFVKVLTTFSLYILEQTCLYLQEKSF